MMRLNIPVRAIAFVGLLCGFAALRGSAYPAPFPVPPPDCKDCQCKMVSAVCQADDGKFGKTGLVFAKKNEKGEYEAAQNASGRNVGAKPDQQGAPYLIMTTNCPAPDDARFVTSTKNKILHVRQPVTPICKAKLPAEGFAFVEASWPEKLNTKDLKEWTQHTCQDKPMPKPKDEKLPLK